MLVNGGGGVMAVVEENGGCVAMQKMLDCGVIEAELVCEECE